MLYTHCDPIVFTFLEYIKIKSFVSNYDEQIVVTSVEYIRTIGSLVIQLYVFH